MRTRRRRTVEIGTYNVEHGHPVAAHTKMILDRFKHYGLRWLALTEVADYVAELNAETEDRLLFVPGGNDVRNQALLVSAKADVQSVRSIPMSATYRAPDGSLRRSMPPLVADVDGVLVLVIHAPVGAWTTGNWKGRRFVGPIMRRIAYRRYVRRLLRFVQAHSHRTIVIIGDWNATPDTTGRWSPAWLAKKAGMTIARPGANTGHGEIDFALVRWANAELGVQRVHPEESDHYLVTGRLAYDA